MSEEIKQEPVSLADRLFKEVTRLEAVELGMHASETEYQHTTRADLVLTVPANLSLDGTMFDFCRSVNVIEFKSQNDSFTVREFTKNEVRTGIQLLQGKDEDYDNILSVIVVSRSPKAFFDRARKRGIKFKPVADKPWLRLGMVGFQDVAIVVCRDLPIEERYYKWLLFAPTDTLKWRDYFKVAYQSGRIDLLNALRRMRPKEFAMRYDKLLEELEASGIFDEPDEQYDSDVAEAAQIFVRRLARKKSKRLADVFSELGLEERLAGLGAEERLAGLGAEERLAGLGAEERLAGLGAEERQKMLELLIAQTGENKKGTKE